MKKLLLFFVPALFLFFSCEQDDIFSRIENTTNGEKWTLQIGSSPTEVYNQLQDLGLEKEIGTVAIVYRKPYSNPKELQNIFPFYRTVTLETKSGIVKRAVVGLNQGKVSSIETGGAMLESSSSWPSDTPDDITIHINDQTDVMYQKLLSIWQISPYNDYQIILPDKSLEDSFDPNMANYDEWAFDFSENIRTNKIGRSFVRLFFNDKKLVKIREEYYENEVVN
ncbi:hypothetical protein [uncultured Sunxiuqinia sp.]|uniref:hypothetical protein n=1 Tax=uncultured Sunxiuqinia sp. TaxID=1573825 RepID=UPI002AA93D65|nr:hypothetical protein [uncultured Sunxiuqinia sp.]